VTWRWIPPLSADGATQMALDAWMLQQLASGASGPMLRLYRWSRPTLSLGVHQRRLEPHWASLETAGLLESVRRPSGGRAVLHAGELTYALVCRPASTRRIEAYGHACRWLQEAFAGLGLPLRFGAAAAVEAHRRSNCFASAAAADLVEPSGAKRIGSAQLWRGPLLLQHGSLLLDPPAPLWRQLFSEDPPSLSALPCTAAELEQCLRAAAEHHLCGGRLIEQPLSDGEWQAVQAGRGAYDSPLACIERATAASAIPSG
jgi:lipoate-protein ligase A